MLKIETYTFAVISFLEQPGDAHHSLVPAIQGMYDGLPSFHLHQQLKFGQWIKDAVVKHPLRQTAKQAQWLAIVDTITEVGLEMSAIPQVVLAAVSARKEWTERVLLPENLPIDQEHKYIFIAKHGLTTLPLTAELEKETCAVCFQSFSEANVTQAAPCTHVLCSRCFPRWIKMAVRACRCPLCRASACLVCGNESSPCGFHTIAKEIAPPLSLPTILDRLLPDKAVEVLHDIKPLAYSELRKATRQDRTRLESFTRWMGRAVRMGDHAGRAVVEADYETVVERVRGEVLKAVGEA
jgi:hypothetical protein